MPSEIVSKKPLKPPDVALVSIGDSGKKIQMMAQLCQSSR